ncbi:hypothetical protein [Desulfocicer niacini]
MDNLSITTMDLYLFLSGPMIWVALGLFIFGTVFQVILFYLFTSSTTFSGRARVTLQKKPAPGKNLLLDRTSLGYRLAQLKLTLPGRRPVFTLLTTFFHINLVLLPFFVQGHTMMVGFATDLFLPSLNDLFVDFMTILTILCAFIFFIKRLFVKEVRSITTFSDFVMLALAVAPFITGFMAYHQLFDSRTMIVLHMASGELMLILIPFTRLVHMIYFFLNRFVMIHQYLLGNRANRVWKSMPSQYKANI